eukprot:gb/GEZN01023591.1/.p1 GENE.gb/GEZN01023591.1/~~gb/GEZN01023591.1/.p1  ORF type:complete len:180 (+),score=14.82 gb/GEZN01023591.1/:26-541(+)
MTRKWKDNTDLMDKVGLMMVDEVHLLSENPRGACLEGMITRCKIAKSNKLTEGKDCVSATNLRILAVSATVPNASDVAQWLECDYFEFGPEYRPVPVDYLVQGFPPRNNIHIFDMILDDKVFSVIHQHSEGKPTLIFCNSRKGTSRVAKAIAKSCSESRDSKFFCFNCGSI